MLLEYILYITAKKKKKKKQLMPISYFVNKIMCLMCIEQLVCQMLNYVLHWPYVI